MSSRRYFGEVGPAARLYAAREAAGFSTAREAARTFGWTESRYRAHEAAARQIREGDAAAYCKAFSVSKRWLATGEWRFGTPPETERQRALEPLWRGRQERLAESLRKANAVEVSATAPSRRVRIARRLAGYRTVTEAARAIGVAHTTLSAVERGLYGLSEKAAQLYEQAFACNSRWLLLGTGASGYATAVESVLPQLLSEYDFPEWKAQQSIRERLSSDDLAGVRRTPELRKPSPPTQDSVGTFDWIPQYDAESVLRTIHDEHGVLASKAGPLWPVPAGHMKTVFKADPKSTFVFVGPYDAKLFRAGDRLFVDVSDKGADPGPDAYYLTCENGRFAVLQQRDPHLKSRDLVVIGRVACAFAQPRGW